MRPSVGTGERHGYVAAMSGLWGNLERVLRRLELIAATDGGNLDDDDLEALPVLQYGLHTAGELAVGIEPPPDAEWAHRELAAALADARDSTAEVAEAAAFGGPEAVAALVPEWRGALFRVRLARMRLTEAPRALPEPRVDSLRREDRGAIAATLLVLAGTFVVTCGAVVGVWPLWAVGLLMVAGGFFAYRP